MIRIALRAAGEPFAAAITRRRRFGLDAPLPADPHLIERAVLRHIAEHCPTILPIAVATKAEAEDRTQTSVDLAAGVPDLLLLCPGGRLACLKIKTQAQTLSRAQRAFADLCRERSIPFHIARSLPEARVILDRLAHPPAQEISKHG